MRFLLVLCIVFAGAALAGTVSRSGEGVEAGTAVRMSVSELAQNAELIVEARVLSAFPIELPDGRIVTEFRLMTAHTFRGDHVAHRAIRLPGGILPDGRGMMLAGMPRVQPGRDVLLFLTGAGESGLRMPIGLAQGKFDVVETAAGEKVLIREQSGLSLIHSPSGHITAAESVAVLPYAEVVAQIEAAKAVVDRR